MTKIKEEEKTLLWVCRYYFHHYKEIKQNFLCHIISMTIQDFDFNSVESFAFSLQFCAKWYQKFLQVLSSGLVKHYEMMIIIVVSSTWPFEMMKFIVLSKLQVIVVDRISRILFPFAFFVFVMAFWKTVEGWGYVSIMIGLLFFMWIHHIFRWGFWRRKNTKEFLSLTFPINWICLVAWTVNTQQYKMHSITVDFLEASEGQLYFTWMINGSFHCTSRERMELR